LAASSHSWTSETFKEDRFDSEVSLRESIQRLHFWIEKYARDRLGECVSAYDFRDRLFSRLVDRIEKGMEPDEIDDHTKQMMKWLVHEDQRTAFRRSQVVVADQRIEHLPDPNSLKFSEQLDIESQMRVLLDRIPPELRPAIDDLYGLHGERVKSRKEVAKQLGWKRNTLDQKLRRLYLDLRQFLDG
jgi:hypothetical protein